RSHRSLPPFPTRRSSDLGGLTLRTHMRMSGSWHVYRPGERWQRSAAAARIVIGTPGFVAVAFDVPVADFLNESVLATEPALAARSEEHTSELQSRENLVC